MLEMTRHEEQRDHVQIHKIMNNSYKLNIKGKHKRIDIHNKIKLGTKKGKNQFIRATRSRIRRHRVMSRSLFFGGIQQRYKYRRATQRVLSLLRCSRGRASERVKMRRCCYRKVRISQNNLKRAVLLDYTSIHPRYLIKSSVSKWLILTRAREIWHVAVSLTVWLFQ